ncbi:MAG: class II fructose-bisphosphatase [Chloroflexi bacterium]|nr:class II fructose-bisphosphatase [Chloroflexota bacterium]
MAELPERNLALELVQVTEAAALAAGRWTGRGDKEAVERAAVYAMSLVLQQIEMDGIVVIGRGDKADTPRLYHGERLGIASAPKLDIVVEPVDGIRLTAEGWPGAVSAAAMAERGTLFVPGPLRYMEKLAVGPEAKDVVDLEAPVAETLQRIAQAKQRDVGDLTVMVLDRPRHIALIEEIRAAGARIRLIRDGDVAAAVYTALPESGIDVLMGIGGAGEAVLGACALKCLGGEILCRPYIRNPEEAEYLSQLQIAEDQVLSSDDLVKGEDIFFAITGVTDGEVLQGVKYFGRHARTHSIVTRSRTGTLRVIRTTYRWDRVMQILR